MQVLSYLLSNLFTQGVDNIIIHKKDRITIEEITEKNVTDLCISIAKFHILSYNMKALEKNYKD
jgi:hypothetical protein